MKALEVFGGRLRCGRRGGRWFARLGTVEVWGPAPAVAILGLLRRVQGC